MPRATTLNPDAAEAMIKSSIRGSVPLYDVVTWVFGRRRTDAALSSPADDPELVQFILLLDAKINREWAKRGISRVEGPYVAKIGIV